MIWKRIGFAAVLAVAGLLVFAAMAPSAFAGDSVNVFSVATPPQVSADGLARAFVADPTIVRRRMVSVNMTPMKNADLPAGDESIVLNLFDDVTLIVVKDKLFTDNQGIQIWQGHVKGSPENTVTMAMDGDQMAANITYGHKHYQVRAIDGAYHVVREIDQSQFKDCGGQLTPPTPPAGESPVAVPDTTPDPSPPAAGVQIDVLVAVSVEAAAASGNINTEIALAVTETNQAYANSGASQTIRLVHLWESSYSDSGNISTDLSRVAGTSDGFLDDVHALRNTYGADCVVLITENGGGYCGLAYLHDTPTASDASTAFSVVARSCATGYYSFGHELGHNMGLRHDCYVDSAGSTDNHGYVYRAGLWRTIMAYNTECTDNGDNCTRVKYFSNPSVNYNGQPTGVNDGGCDAQSYSTLDTYASVVAAWSAATVPNSSGGSTGGGGGGGGGGCFVSTMMP